MRANSLGWLSLSLSAVQSVCSEKICLTQSDGIDLFSRNYRLEFANNDEFKLKGLNWFGFETGLYVVHGLWAQSVDYFLDFISENKFNAVRLPLAVDTVLNDPAPPSYTHTSCFFDGTITSLEALDYIIERLAERGILVLLDQHGLVDGYISPCYTDDDHPESMIVEFWDKLVDRYEESWNVMGVDLKNEPHGCKWRDWVDFATRMGNHILQRVPRWLVFVEGIGSEVTDEDRWCVDCTEGTFWGENLMGVCNYTVVFNTTEKQKKLVYSPHAYGPSVYRQTYFDDDTFPDNMPAIWECHFGFLNGLSIFNLDENAVVVGEWGGKYTDSNRKPDKTWHDAYAQWADDSKGLPGTFYWCLNENSGDTGGLLDGNKWLTPEIEKLALLDSLQPDPTLITVEEMDFCYQDWVSQAPFDPWSCSPASGTSTTTAPQTGECAMNATNCVPSTNPTQTNPNECNPNLCCTCSCTHGKPSSRTCT